MPDRRTETITAAVRDLVDRDGYDLEGVEVTSAGSRRAIAVIIDRDGGVSLDTLAQLTREISDRLDADDPFGDAEYTLEVTTPGIERPLSASRHWRRALGRRATIRLVGGEELVARIGALTGVGGTDSVGAPDSVGGPDSSDSPDSEGGASVEVVLADRKKGPQVRRLPLSSIEHAVVDVEFAPAPAAELALCGVGSPEAANRASGSEAADSAAAGEGV